MSKLVLLAACAFSAAAVTAMAALSNGAEQGAASAAADRSSAAAEAEPSAALPAPPPAGAFPNTDDGLPVMQTNPTWALWTAEADPFLNLLRATGGWSARQDWPGQDVMDFAAMIAGGHIDPETLLPVSIPEGFDYVQSGLMRGGARNYPAYYAGRYVLEWEGDADIRFGLGQHNFEKRDGPRRKALDLAPADRSRFPIEIRRIGPGGLSSLAVFRAEDEAALKAGGVWTPKWLDHLRGYKIIRDLDIQHATYSWRTGPQDAAPWSGLPWVFRADGPPGAPAGPPLRAVFELAVLTDTALWHVMPPALGADAAALHEIGGIAGWRERGDARKAYAKENAAAIADSPKWRAYADHLVAAMIAAGYPETRTLYLELGNEVWNFSSPFGEHTHYFWSLGEGLEAAGRLSKNGEYFRNALGWLTAQMATHVSAALTAAGREGQPVVFVLAGQNAWPARTEMALRGFEDYFAWKGGDAGPWLARTGVSTASYFDGKAFEKDAGKGGFFPAASDAERDAKWIAAVEADPEGLKRRLTDHIIDGPDGQGGTLPWVVRNRAAHQEIAERFGAFFLGDYEGHSHLNPPASLKDPSFINWYEAWSYGPHMAEITHEWVRALRDQNPDAVISNYAIIGARDPEGDAPDDANRPPAWIDMMWEDENDRTRAFEDYLRKGGE